MEMKATDAKMPEWKRWLVLRQPRDPLGDGDRPAAHHPPDRVRGQLAARGRPDVRRHHLRQGLGRALHDRRSSSAPSSSARASGTTCGSTSTPTPSPPTSGKAWTVHPTGRSARSWTPGSTSGASPRSTSRRSAAGSSSASAASWPSPMRPTRRSGRSRSSSGEERAGSDFDHKVLLDRRRGDRRDRGRPRVRRGQRRRPRLLPDPLLRRALRPPSRPSSTTSTTSSATGSSPTRWAMIRSAQRPGVRLPRPGRERSATRRSRRSGR